MTNFLSANGLLLWAVVAVILVVIFLGNDVLSEVCGYPAHPKSSILWGLGWPIGVLVIVWVFIRMTAARLRGVNSPYYFGSTRFMESFA